MSPDDLNTVRAEIAAEFEAINETWLPAAVTIAVIAYGGTLIGPEDPGGPAEWQLELIGVTGFGNTPAAAARQWTLNVARMCDPANALEDSEC
ncbi:hypothetical protein [Roseovarius ramblicola]|uniref:Uncharacterized protein n=1 Tax=Roseovarius ramblicola TaxID=2022336 RepID=A0ABV5I0F6_9RHOB